MDGHGAGVGGCIVDSGKFDWNAHADKFPGLTSPDESYHGVVYTERFGLEHGAGEPSCSHGAALQKRPVGCRVPFRPPESGMGSLLWLAR